jgi:hypothetical protein
MARMGHDSMNAAIRYQHATREADRVLADALDVRVRAHRRLPSRSTRDADEGDDEAHPGTG